MLDTHEYAAIELHGGGSQVMVLGVSRDGVNSPRGFGEPGTVYCSFFNVFWCLTDVYPGDGGLIVATGSHKSEFECPYVKLYDYAEDVPQGVVNITPKAGDAIIHAESVYHGALRWNPTDRDRRFLTLRYLPQYLLTYHIPEDRNVPKEVKDRLAPQTRELIETAWRSHEKEISKRDEIRLI